MTSTKGDARSTAAVPIRRIVVLGGSGDLMMRYLAPALAELSREGRLDDRVTIAGVDRGDFATDVYRKEIASALATAGADRTFAARFTHATADVTDASSVGRAIEGEGPALVYFALPQAVVPKGVAAVAKTRLPEGSRVAIEKPFGDGADSARRLNALLAQSFDADRVFRVDHFLAMRAVRTLLVARLADRALEAIACAEHVERVEIVWDETLGLEDRAGYYDSAGALVDMVQSHLLQVLAMIAMAPPRTLDGRDVAACRLATLQRTRLRDPQRPNRCVVRARYGAGTIGGREVIAYADEDGVDPKKRTETFVQLELRVDDPRWSGVPFVVRTGKALGRDRMEVVFVLREPSHAAAAGEARRARIVFDLEPEGLVRESFTAGEGWSPEPVTLSWRPERAARSPYAEVLDAILRGEHGFFPSGPEVEVSWRLVEPVLEAFRDDRVELREYPAGGAGPSTEGMCESEEE